jgi:NADH:ubiquinone oxidoreductase subunit E
MTARRKSSLEEVLESCRPAPPTKPNILQVLLAVQEAVGCVSAKMVPRIAHVLGVTDPQVAGVLSYYPDLRTESPGRCVIRVCMGESCTANHGGRVLRAIQDLLSIDVGDTTPGRRFTLEKVYCVGNCAVSPTVIVGEELCGRVTPSQIPSILEPRNK